MPMQPEPKPGDFGVVVGSPLRAIIDRNLGAAATEIITHGPAYHALICTDPGKAMEARPHGAGYVDTSHYDGRVLWSHQEDLTDTQRKLLVHHARSFEGTAYGWTDDLAIGLGALGVNIPTLTKRLLNPNTVICSQLVALCYSRSFIPLLDKEPWKVTPNDLRDVILRMPVPANW